MNEHRTHWFSVTHNNKFLDVINASTWIEAAKSYAIKMKDDGIDIKWNELHTTCIPKNHYRHYNIPRDKMRIGLISDAHLEFNKFEDIFKDDFNKQIDLLILAGDITVIDQDITNGDIARICKLYHDIPIIYVTGNHEYYSIQYIKQDVDKHFKDLSLVYDNLTVLNNESITIDKIQFFGGTMWSELNTVYPVILNSDRDYITARDSNGKQRKIDFRDVIGYHLQFKEKLEEFLIGDNTNKVIVSHFPPSRVMAHPEFMKNIPIDDYFSASMEKYFAYDNPPAAWFYGHNHYTDKRLFDNGCLVESSQVGYPWEPTYNGLRVILL